MKLNNKGFAITSIIYSMLILFLTLVVLIIGNLASRKAIFDKQKEEILDKFEEYKTLPSEYQELEYIESTGTQYIDSGYIPTIDTTVRIKVTYGENAVFGSESILWTTTPDPGNSGFIIAGHTNMNDNVAPTEYVKYFKPDGDKIFYNASDSEPYEIEMTPTYSVITYKDNTTEKITYQMEGNGSEYSAYIFARNTAGTVAEYSSRKLYYLKIYDGEQLVRDFIPCYRISDNVAGLYDLVENKFYTNDGTGEFIQGKFGEEIIPETKPCEIVSGDTTTFESEIKCGTESFYLISSTDSTVTMLTKYLVRSVAGGQYDTYQSGKYGNLNFSSTNYWSNTNYSLAFVYNENSSLYQRINQYINNVLKTYITKTEVTGTLMSYEQANKLGCNRSSTSFACDTAPDWLYSDSYWLGTASDTSNMGVLMISHEGRIGGYKYSRDDIAGLRPLITINKSEIK